MNAPASSNALIGLCCFATITGMACSKKEKTEKPNIILVMADDQGWGDMRYYGHPQIKTPNFDDMVSSGLRFDRFYAAAPVSSPTRGSVMTGRHPNRYGCFSWGRTIRPQEITIAEALKTAGYVTGHFGKWHLGPVFEGSPINPGNCGFDEWFSAPNFFDNDPILSRKGHAVQTFGESSMVTVDAAIEFIRDQVDARQPFFTVVWFGSPHLPYLADDQDREPYLELEKNLQHYYGEITGMDRAFGKLRRELRRLGINKNTILWYCSDNGGVSGVSVTGGRGHKGQIYEGGLRIPAILEWPDRIPEPMTTDFPCTTSDIYPTLLEIAGIEIKDQYILDGISILPLIENKMTFRSKPIGFWQYPVGGIGVSSVKLMSELLNKQNAGDLSVDSARLELNAGNITVKYPEDIFPGHSAWLDWPFKLHRIQDNSGTIKTELYNLEEDSEEENDISEKESFKLEAMKSELENWQFSVIKSLNGEEY